MAALVRKINICLEHVLIVMTLVMAAMAQVQAVAIASMMDTILMEPLLKNVMIPAKRAQVQVQAHA